MEIPLNTFASTLNAENQGSFVRKEKPPNPNVGYFTKTAPKLNGLKFKLLVKRMLQRKPHNSCTCKIKYKIFSSKLYKKSSQNMRNSRFGPKLTATIYKQ